MLVYEGGSLMMVEDEVGGRRKRGREDAGAWL
jgi:hypothetical protein